MKSLVLFSTLLVQMVIAIPVKAVTLPPECKRNNTRSAYVNGYYMAEIQIKTDLNGVIDSPQDLYDKYPPGQGSYANIDTEPEIECYKKGIVDGFKRWF